MAENSIIKMVNAGMEIGFIMAAMPGKPSATLFNTPRPTTQPPCDKTEAVKAEKETRYSTDIESLLKGMVSGHLRRVIHSCPRSERSSLPQHPQYEALLTSLLQVQI